MQNKDLKIIFAGTPEFALPALENLVAENFNIITVFTQPDKPQGRDQVITPSPVKKLAEKLNLSILQPKSLKSASTITKLRELAPDLIVVVAYGKMIPNEILELPKFGVINIHPSLLPKFRGPSPIQSALLNGDTETGVTIMLLDQGMDSGPILAQEKINISEEDNAETLHDKLSNLGARLLIKIIPQYLADAIKPQPQDESTATICKLLTREDGQINWNKSAQEIYNQIRAFTPWPGAFTIWNDKRIKIIQAHSPSNETHKMADKQKIGDFFTDNNKLFAQCASGALEISTLQPEGKKPMGTKEFINGYLK